MEMKPTGAGAKASADGADPAPSHFIRNIVAEDLNRAKTVDGCTPVFRRSPTAIFISATPSPSASISALPRNLTAHCNLRFDDTNPSKEDVEYVESIKEDVRWLGFDWADREFYASDYFEQLYQFALQLIQDGKAFVCDLSADQMREYRGTLTEPGRNSPFRDRSVEDNLDLFQRMRAGEFPDGSRTLRAKIDMASPNINLRDPVMYRVLRATHHRTGDHLVHLSDLRLCPRTVGLHRRHYPFHLHAGVRRPPAALRLVSRPAGDSSSAADRIRASQSHLYGDE